MLHATMVQEIRRLLTADGLSQRAVALRTGVSRGTVHAIARGKRPETRHRDPDDDYPRPTGPWQRCPTCGGKVQMPCLLCGLRARRAAERIACGLALPSAIPVQPHAAAVASG
jgi:hypothetical protein